MSKKPLVVDLDGTLLKTDTLFETALFSLRKQPKNLISGAGALFKGKAAVKAALAKGYSDSLADLPINSIVLDEITSARKAKRPVHLATAANEQVASALFANSDLFDEIHTSNLTYNLAGKNKADFLVSKFGINGFDYIGDSTPDLEVWKAADVAFIVDPNPHLLRKFANLNNSKIVLRTSRQNVAKTWLKAARAHQWLKNLLLFVPAIAGHVLNTQGALERLGVAFLAFSLASSSVYIFNDLLDLSNDRKHSSKSKRAFASGELSIGQGLIAGPLLVFSALILAQALNPLFFIVTAIYVALTLAYSFYLKKIAVLDVLVLAMLYTIRVIAGAVLLGVSLTFWILAFSVFLFLSLALVKRFSELQNLAIDGAGSNSKANGRGYLVADLPLIQSFGVAAGVAASVVLALYVNSPEVFELYRAPELIWLEVPVVLSWLMWVWLKAGRGQMHEDPVIFAAKDKASLVIASIFLAVFLLATVAGK